MPRIGRFEYPEVGLIDSLVLGRLIVDDFGGEVSRRGLAGVLAMSERGGAFAVRVGALRMWGIAIGRGRLRITRDGLRAIKASGGNEILDANGILVNQIPLFKEINKRIKNAGYDESMFAVLLGEITGESPETISKKISNIDRIFMEVKSFLNPLDSNSLITDRSQEKVISQSDNWFRPDTDALKKESDTGSRDEKDNSGQLKSDLINIDGENDAVKTAVINLSFTDVNISLPETPANIEALLLVLSARKKRLEDASSE